MLLQGLTHSHRAFWKCPLWHAALRSHIAWTVASACPGQQQSSSSNALAICQPLLLSVCSQADKEEEEAAEAKRSC